MGCVEDDGLSTPTWLNDNLKCMLDVGPVTAQPAAVISGIEKDNTDDHDDEDRHSEASISPPSADVFEV